MSFTRNLQNYLKQNNHTPLKSGDGGEWSNAVEDYEFGQQIGSGSFGQVFKAKSGGRQCAIKRITKAKSPNIAKILSEVSIHIRLSHRHILQLFNVLEDRQNVYLVMEVCHGGSLAQLIARQVEHRKAVAAVAAEYPPKPVLPYTVIGTILRQLCLALEYLHRNGIVHRDLNLNNILLVEPFTIPLADEVHSSPQTINLRLADFGLAIDLNASRRVTRNDIAPDAASMGNTICGTPGFISPEIWTQLRTPSTQVVVSPKSDIYSLGSIVFACIAGYTPSGNIELNNFLPMTADLIAQLLEGEPDKRPELEGILSHIFVSGRIDSTRLHPIEKTTKNVRMSIDKAGAAVLCFLKDQLTISASADGSRIGITTPQLPTKEYSFYELPQCYWKRYSYLIRFIKLVKAKTAKITVHCGKWFKEDIGGSSHCCGNPKEYISRCTLMENGDFEVTLHNQVLDEDFRFLLNEEVSKSMQRYRGKLEELHGKLLEVESEFTQMGLDMKTDLFPITFGLNEKVHELYGVNSECTGKTSQPTHSQVLRSMRINGIGFATQFSNGSIKVNFNDGSDLCMDNESQIFYVENNVLKRFNKDDLLPQVVLGKIARMRQVIDHFQQSQHNSALPPNELPKETPC